MYPKNEDIHQRHYETEIDVNTIIRIVSYCLRKDFNALLISINARLFLTKRRAILIGVIASIAAAIILTPLILTLTLPPDINAVRINLDKVEVDNPSPEEESANLLTLRSEEHTSELQSRL